jgi:hypothetical protein
MKKLIYLIFGSLMLSGCVGFGVVRSTDSLIGMNIDDALAEMKRRGYSSCKISSEKRYSKDYKEVYNQDFGVCAYKQKSFFCPTIYTLYIDFDNQTKIVDHTQLFTEDSCF